MDILVALLFILLLLVIFRAIRRDEAVATVHDETSPEHFGEPGQSPSDALDYLAHFEGSICIYLDRSVIHKARVIQAEAQGDEAQLRLQVLRTEGLNDSPDEIINISAPLKTLDHSSTHLHAPYVNWQLFVDIQLIDEVTHLARSGESPAVLKRILLDHRMARRTSPS